MLKPFSWDYFHCQYADHVPYKSYMNHFCPGPMLHRTSQLRLCSVRAEEKVTGSKVCGITTKVKSNCHESVNIGISYQGEGWDMGISLNVFYCVVTLLKESYKNLNLLFPSVLPLSPWITAANTWHALTYNLALDSYEFMIALNGLRCSQLRYSSSLF